MLMVSEMKMETNNYFLANKFSSKLFDITNAATGNDPKLSALGDDSNIDLAISPKGTGEL